MATRPVVSSVFYFLFFLVLKNSDGLSAAKSQQVVGLERLGKLGTLKDMRYYSQGYAEKLHSVEVNSAWKTCGGVTEDSESNPRAPIALSVEAAAPSPQTIVHRPSSTVGRPMTKHL
jgi:hypothetical protein